MSFCTHRTRIFPGRYMCPRTLCVVALRLILLPLSSIYVGKIRIGYLIALDEALDSSSTKVRNYSAPEPT